MINLFNIFLNIFLFILDLEIFKYSFYIIAIMSLFTLTYRLIGHHYYA